jgi:hypothetical protein
MYKYDYKGISYVDKPKMEHYMWIFWLKPKSQNKPLVDCGQLRLCLPDHNTSNSLFPLLHNRYVRKDQYNNKFSFADYLGQLVQE